ncbi:MAG TPA: M48 family metalloprotease [Gaiellaceae bacterium]|nr:M48 family metalloprotease [Gaiellaceae bacterium]
MRGLDRLVAPTVLVGCGVAGALALWPTTVPDDLRLPRLDLRDVFGANELRDAERFESFLRWNSLLSIVVALVVLGLYARYGGRFASESAAGPVGTGMMLGMLGLGILWISQIPFGLAEIWWARRHDAAEVGYVEWLLGYWLGLAGEFGFICLALAIVMGFAQVLRDRWWVAGAPTFVALYVLFAFSLPRLVFDDYPLLDRKLQATARQYAREEGTRPIPVRVERVSSYTDSPNAYAAGMDSSRHIFIWDTLLDGRFSDDEVHVVLAHEIAHHAREHIWKSIGWYALFAVPGTYLIALATRRRGSLAEAQAVPLALFVFVALNVAAQPLTNVVSRRFEAEADWVALETTEDPDAARALFRDFTRFAHADPAPPEWATLLFDNHPTMLDRIRMAEAWRARSEGRSHP